jgi:hypothetical protein
VGVVIGVIDGFEKSKGRLIRKRNSRCRGRELTPQTLPMVVLYVNALRPLPYPTASLYSLNPSST